MNAQRLTGAGVDEGTLRQFVYDEARIIDGAIPIAERVLQM